MYRYGIGVSKNIGKSCDYLIKGVNKNHIPSIVTLADLYNSGIEVLKNEKILEHYLDTELLEILNKKERIL